MPDWLVERGIGETRAVLIEDREIVEARALLDGQVAAGTLLTAKLKSVGRNAVAIADGREYLLPKGATGVTQGATLTIEVTREAIGAEGWKRPLARLADGSPAGAPSLAGRRLQFPSPADELEQAGWSDLIEEARSGIVAFPGGELRIVVTPAAPLGRRYSWPLAIATAFRPTLLSFAASSVPAAT